MFSQFTMKSMISILLFVTLPFVIYGGIISKKYPADVAMLDEMAKTEPIINEVLKLKEDGFLGEGFTGFVYEGNYLLRHKNRTIVSERTLAIKFVPEARSAQAKREYEMYIYLKAYNTPEVAKYGIPTVYYYGKWKKFSVTALSKLDTSAAYISCTEHKFNNPLDVLILMRNFIIQLKYIHSCGVRHDDINPANIMVRGHKSFLIDFDMSSKIMEDNFNGSTGFAARKLHRREPRLAIDDLESFFYTICHMLGCPFGWFRLEPSQIDLSRVCQITNGLKNLTHKVLDCIDANVGEGVLKTVIYEFAKAIYANSSEAFPDYNYLFELVSDELSKLRVKTTTLLPIFSWLPDDQKVGIAREIHSQRPLKIRDIVEPKSIDFATFVYPVVEDV